ncbi:MAG: DUF11 domain-containing protein [Fimbriiglobus sp.]|jgi:hypothetical protein|nr:DUF11 domain-containing protein [Fimbriiglobus sp.]
MRSGSAGAIVRGVVLAAVCGAALVSAQVPLTIVDPNLQPVQRLDPPVPPASIADSPRPSPANGITATPGRGSAPVVDPPAPVVQLQVRTPAHVPVGKPVPYRITVTNTSTAKALRLKLRMPWPDGAEAMTRCEPRAENVGEATDKQPLPPLKELSWAVGDLERGQSKTYELTFKPAPATKKVSGTAYVSFEYGAKVETAVDAPKLEVARTADERVAIGELMTVKVAVTNPTPVAVANVRLTEVVPPAEAEFRTDPKAEQPPGQPGVRVWDLGTLAPGQSKIVQYQLKTRRAGELVTSSTAVGADATASNTSRTKVLSPGLHLALTGPPTATPKGAAEYLAEVRNTGTLPLTDVALVLDVPEELTITRRTNGMKKDSGRPTWIVPRLEPGEAQQFKIECVPGQGVAGRKLLKASAQDGRGRVAKQSAEAATDFVGKAEVSWQTKFDSIRVGVGRQGTLIVAVKNHGAETEKALRLRVKLPPEVKYVGNNGVYPATLENAVVLFPAQTLPPGKAAEFIVTYEGKSPGTGRFELTLEADSLGKALTKEQEVLVER